VVKKEAVKTWSTPRIQEESRIVPCTLCGSSRFRPALSCEGFSYVRCTCCGLVQMNPQPLASEIKRRYGAADTQGGYGGDYLAYELANEKSFLKLQLLALKDAGFWEMEREIENERKEKTNLESGIEHKTKVCANKGKILDIGCATGSLLEELKKCGWDCVGAELSEAQAAYARENRGLEVYSLPLEESEFPKNSFDVILASHLIEHLNDPSSLVKEVWRILAPGGRFFITTPNISGFQARLFGGKWRSAIFDHLYLFSDKTLGALLEKYGFYVEKKKTWGGLAAGTAPTPVKRLFDWGAKRFGFGDVMIMRAVKIPLPFSPPKPDDPVFSG
jgi:2-polyprenyl-3-methyl-5-hydroxy-6-metoxy-1,4-benzoquinol methylase